MSERNLEVFLINDFLKYNYLEIRNQTNYWYRQEGQLINTAYVTANHQPK